MDKSIWIGYSMKGLDFILTLMIVIIFLILSVLLVFLVVGSASAGSGEKALAERFVTAVRNACYTGQETKVEVKMSQPNRYGGFEGLSLPGWLGGANIFSFFLFHELTIKAIGDPNTLFYYELFPPGEAIGWEIYHGFGHRSIVMMDRQTLRIQDLHNTIEQKSRKIRQLNLLPNDKKVFTIIGNIVLNDQINLSGGLADEKEGNNIGKWDKDNFKFKQYDTLEREEKTALKYMSCGDNVLCMKTRTGIDKYPLEECEGKADFIQLEAKDKADGNFYLASPCEATAKISLGTCECNLVSYPIYELRNNRLEKIGDHLSCVNLPTEAAVASGEFDCIKIKLEDKKGFCYAPIESFEDLYRIDIEARGFFPEAEIILLEETKPVEYIEDGSDDIFFYPSSTEASKIIKNIFRNKPSALKWIWP